MRWLRSAMAVLAFWLVLAIPAQAGELAWGVLIALAIGLWSVVFLWRGGDPGVGARQIPGLLVHLIEMLRSIVPAALQLIGILIRRSMPLRPGVFKYTTELEGDAARVALANSITLTPGTHCVEIDGNELTIHCLDPSFARSIRSGDAEREIRRVFEPGASEVDGGR
ncbi:MAG: Na+/H+ antiporter subunit E [Wenzhouxiangellaceae bacterium]|nr:Na+/H+ antiporter subunit E [Wenzhouxiangellaceae bacterium]